MQLNSKTKYLAGWACPQQFLQSMPSIVRNASKAALHLGALACVLVSTVLHAQTAPINPVSTTGPSGEQVIRGQATVTRQGANTTVVNTPGTIINWQRFDVPAGASTYFQQQNANSTVLNQVVTNNPSQIFGTLGSNGRIILVNQSGIVVGSGAVIDSAGFLASTLKVQEANADLSQIRFRNDPSNPSGGLRIDGVIRSSNGDIILIAPDIQVGSNALIKATDGAVTLAAGQQVALRGRGLDGITLEIQAPSDQAINLGRIEGDAVGIFASQLRHSGQIQATTASLEGGRVILRAQENLTVTGVVNAVGTGSNARGGTITFEGNRIELQGARVDASGNAGGGAVQIGGGWQGRDARIRNSQWTYISSDTIIKADALRSGNGGLVVIWSDGNTWYEGTIQARGGIEGGDGGKVEVSGKENLRFTGIVRIDAPRGQGGTLLLDPKNIYITAGPTNPSTISFTATAVINATDGGTADYYISAADLQNAITNAGAGSTVILQATNDIGISSSVALTGQGSLYFEAGRNITLGNNVNLSFSDSCSPTCGFASIYMTANSAGVGANASNRDAGTGSIIMNPGSSIQATAVNLSLGAGGTPGSIQLGDITANTITADSRQGSGISINTGSMLSATESIILRAGNGSIGDSANPIHINTAEITAGAPQGNVYLASNQSTNLTLAGRTIFNMNGLSGETNPTTGTFSLNAPNAPIGFLGQCTPDGAGGCFGGSSASITAGNIDIRGGSIAVYTGVPLPLLLNASENINLTATSGALTIGGNGILAPVTVQAGNTLNLNASNYVGISIQGGNVNNATVTVSAGTVSMQVTTASNFSGGYVDIRGGNGNASSVVVESQSGNLNIETQGVNSAISIRGGDGSQSTAVVQSTGGGNVNLLANQGTIDVIGGAGDNSHAQVLAPNANINMRATNVNIGYSANNGIGTDTFALVRGDEVNVELQARVDAFPALTVLGGSTQNNTASLVATANSVYITGTGGVVVQGGQGNQSSAVIQSVGNGVYINTTGGDLEIKGGNGAGSNSSAAILASNGAVEISMTPVGGGVVSTGGSITLTGGSGSNNYASISGVYGIDMTGSSIAVSGGTGTNSAASIDARNAGSGGAVNITATTGDLRVEGGTANGASASIRADFGLNLQVPNGNVLIYGGAAGNNAGATISGGQAYAVDIVTNELRVGQASQTATNASLLTHSGSALNISATSIHVTGQNTPGANAEIVGNTSGAMNVTATGITVVGGQSTTAALRSQSFNGSVNIVANTITVGNSAQDNSESHISSTSLQGMNIHADSVAVQGGLGTNSVARIDGYYGLNLQSASTLVAGGQGNSATTSISSNAGSVTVTGDITIKGGQGQEADAFIRAAQNLYVSGNLNLVGGFGTSSVALATVGNSISVGGTLSFDVANANPIGSHAVVYAAGNSVTFALAQGNPVTTLTTGINQTKTFGIIVPPPDVSTTIALPPTAPYNSTINATITYSNPSVFTMTFTPTLYINGITTTLAPVTLAPNTTTQVTQPVYIGAAGATATIKIGATSVPELNTANNVATAMVNTAPADLSTSVSLPPTAIAGSTAVATVTVSNTGASGTSMTLTIVAGTQTITTQTFVAAGGTVSFTTTLAVGIQNSTVSAVVSSSTIADANLGNNANTQTIVSLSPAISSSVVLPNTGAVGQTVSGTVTYTNNGNATTNFVATIAVAGGITQTASLTLTPGASTSLPVIVTLTAGANTVTTGIPNSSVPQSNTSGNVASSIVLGGNNDIATVIALPPNAVAGTNANATITYTNLGSFTNVVTSTVFVNGVATTTSFTLNPGQSITTVTAVPVGINGATVSNIVSTSLPDGSTTNNQSAGALSALTPSISSTIALPSIGQIGQTVSGTVTYSNNGNATSSFVSSVVVAGGVTQTQTISNLAPGQSVTVPVVVTVTGVANTVTAGVPSSSVPQANTSGNVSSSSLSGGINDVSTTISLPPNAVAGTNANATITYTNLGSFTSVVTSTVFINGVATTTSFTLNPGQSTTTQAAIPVGVNGATVSNIVTTNLPDNSATNNQSAGSISGLTPNISSTVALPSIGQIGQTVSGTVTYTNNGNATSSFTSTVFVNGIAQNITVSNLAPGASTTVAVNVPVAGGANTVTAGIASTQVPQTSTAANTASTAFLGGNNDISTTVVLPVNAIAGSNANATITYVNLGSFTNVVTSTVFVNGNPVTSSFSLAPGASLTTITVVPVGVNGASVSSVVSTSLPDNSATNNQMGGTIASLLSDISTSVALPSTGIAGLGGIVTATYSNLGSAPTSFTANIVVNGVQTTTVVNLNPGQSIALPINVIFGNTQTNVIAGVSGVVVPEGNTGNNLSSGSLASTPGANPGVSIAAPGSAVPGTVGVLTVTVSNLGVTTATGVVALVTLPTGATTSINVGTLSAGASSVQTLSYSIGAAATGNATASAQVSSSSPDASASNNVAGNIISLTPQVNLGVSASPVTLTGGVTTTIPITVVNTGPSVASGTLSFALNGQTQLFSVSNLAPGASMVFNGSAFVPSGSAGTQMASINVTSNQPDTQTNNDFAALSFPLSVPVVSVPTPAPITQSTVTPIIQSILIALNQDNNQPVQNTARERDGRDNVSNEDAPICRP